MQNFPQKFKIIAFFAIIILAGFAFAGTASAAYYTSGDWTSVNLLSGETVTSIDSFVYNLSAKPASTGATIQFSQDNTNWYDSAGTLNASSTLTTGVDNTISLSSLGWSGANFYYKVTFTSDGVDTPVMDDITVNFTLDATAPTVSTLSPADNATGVATSANLVITFSEAVDAEAGVNNDIVIKKTSDNSIIETIDAQDAKVTGSGTVTIIINPAATLAEQTGYYVQIGADAFDDTAGNSYAGISDTTSWSFTTADETNPTVNTISSDKADGAYTTDEIIDIDVTFSEAVTSTGDVTITLETGDTDRTCTFTISNSTTGTCNYTVQAGDTASDLDATISGTITDQSDNSMTDFTPSTTLATNKDLVIDTTAPSVSLSSPANNSSGTDNTPTITWSGSDATAGISSYTLYINGLQTTSGSATSYTPSSAFSCGDYTWYVAATDNAGNTSDSSTYSFTISCSGGGLPPSAWNFPSPPASSPENPEGDFKVIINNNVGKTNNRIVNLDLLAGTNVTKMAISNTGDFKDAGQEEYQKSKTWDVCSKFSGFIKLPDCPDGTYTVYVKYYTEWGRASAVVSDTIILDTTPKSVEEIKEPQKPFIKKEETPISTPPKPTPPPPYVGRAMPLTEKESEFDEPIINIFSKNIVLDQAKPLKLAAGTNLNISVKPVKPVSAVKVIIVFKKPKQSSYLNNSDNYLFGFALVSPVYAQTPENDQVIIEHDWQIAEYFLADTDGDGVFEGKINLPEVAGEYVIRTIFYYEDGTVEDIENKVLIDPKGYLYEHIDGKELRIPNATISIYWLNQKTNKYELWPAQDFDQKNPQITDKTGEYSFFVPEGKYYLTTEALDYRNFQSEKFEAKEGEVINKNIELTPVRKFDWRWLMASFVFIMGLLIGTFVKYWYLPTKKKILIWLAIVGLILVFGVLAIRFAPGLFSSRETKLENKETPASVPQEKSIGSQLIPKTQENVEVIFGTGEDEKTTEAAKTQNPELRITNTPTGWLNVRDAASLDGKTIGKVYPGDEYEYTNEKNGWYEIILKDKTEGWIFGSYAEKIKN